MSTSNRYNIIGYGICGANERYLKGTLDCFKKLCDRVVIMGNNIDRASEDLIASYGFELRKDNREWGLNQNKIKQDFVESLEAYRPEWLVCLDMDEVLDVSREDLELLMDKTDSMYVYIANLWNDGWKKAWSFWNIRAWKWNGNCKFINRPLHCGLAPEWAYNYGSYVPILLWHYGLKDKDARQRKVERYEKYDPKAKYRDRSYYEALKSDTCEPIDEEFIRNAIKKESNPMIKKFMPAIKKRFVYVRNPSGYIYDIPEKDMAETLKRKGFTFIGYEDDNKAKMEELFGDKPKVDPIPQPNLKNEK